MLKGKSRLCQFLSHFTTYFPKVSYVNSKRSRKEGCSNEGEKKANGRERKERKQLRHVKSWFSRLRGKHNPLLLGVSTIIISLLLHLEQKRMYLFRTTLRVECPHDIIQGRLYLVCFCPIITIWIPLSCYSTNKVTRSQIDLEESIVVIVGRNPDIGSF